MKVFLSADEIQKIINGMEVARNEYNKDAELMQKPSVSNIRLYEQFMRQSEDASKLIDKLSVYL